MSQSASKGISDENNNVGNVQQFLTFVLNDETYGVGILHIREIIEYDNLTVVPLMPDFISGVINLRGNVVPVVNLAKRFEHQAKEVGKRTSIVIIDIQDKEIEVGSNVELWGSNINIKDVSNSIETIPYELMCNLGNRLKKIYI